MNSSSAGNQCLLERAPRRRAVAAGGERHVEHVGRGIVGAAARIERMLKEARHQHALAPRGRAEYVLGAVAVMHVEIDDGDPLEPLGLERVGGRHRDVVEDAKTHGARRRGMVAARPHRAECVLRAARR